MSNKVLIQVNDAYMGFKHGTANVYDNRIEFILKNGEKKIFEYENMKDISKMATEFCFEYAKKIYSIGGFNKNNIDTCVEIAKGNQEIINSLLKESKIETEVNIEDSTPSKNNSETKTENQKKELINTTISETNNKQSTNNKNNSWIIAVIVIIVVIIGGIALFGNNTDESNNDNNETNKTNELSGLWKGDANFPTNKIYFGCDNTYKLTYTVEHPTGAKTYSRTGIYEINGNNIILKYKTKDGGYELDEEFHFYDDKKDSICNNKICYDKDSTNYSCDNLSTLIK